MRTDTPIYFQTIKAEYDASTGDYSKKTVTEVQRYASVTDTGADTLNLIYGELKQGVLTVRILGHYDAPFDRIRIGATVYKVDRQRRLRQKHTFIVSEV